jgi:GTP cyclohydrolase FolE2
MGAGNISQEMLKNPQVDEKTKSNVQKWPFVEDMKRKIVQKISKVVAPRKWG